MSILFHNTMKVVDGRFDEFAEAIRDAVAFVEQHGPQQMVRVFLDRERGLAHSFQVYPDSDAVLEHWRMSDPYIQAVMQHCTVQSFETYGELSDEVVAGLTTGAAGSAAVRPELVGFIRS